MSDHGRFIWYELMTPDVAGAKAFYAALLGWDLDEMDGGGMPYTVVGPGVGIGGIMALTEDMKAVGIPPNWKSYVAVDNVDAAVARVAELGGAVQLPPMDIPEVGRFAVIADPHGAVIAIMTPAPRAASPPSPPPGPQDPGGAGWRELYAGDLDSAFAFYSQMFGWTKDADHDLGPIGIYRLFGNQDGQMGGMMTKPPQVPVPAWLYYFNVADIHASTDRLKSLGGQVMNGPMEVPDGSWIVQAMDPQGAMFALTQPKRG